VADVWDVIHIRGWTMIDLSDKHIFYCFLLSNCAVYDLELYSTLVRLGQMYCQTLIRGHWSK
jgi:hypothetical protein